MKRLLLAILVLAVTSTVTARELIAEEKNAVENTIRREMLDPDAAKIHFLDYPTEESRVYCGLVNGKNAFGAYIGDKLFSVFLIKNKYGEYKALSLNYSKVTGEANDQEVIAATCSGVGYDVKVPKSLVKHVNKDRKKNGIPPLTKDLIYAD